MIAMLRTVPVCLLAMGVLIPRLCVALLRSGGDPAAARPGFVTLQGARFAQDGRTLSPYWATFYPHWERNGTIERGGAWADPAFPRYVDAMIGMAEQAHLNTLRATDFLDGAVEDWRSPTVWANMDAFVHRAAAHHLHVIISIDAYRKWLIRHNADPYDPAHWTDYLRFFCRRYADETSILYIPVAGELPPPNSKNPWKAMAARYVAFYRSMLATLRELDPHHLHTVGGLSFLNNPHYGIPWQELFSLPGCDLAAIHVYSEGDLNISLPAVSQWCASRKTPLVLEEFGAKQSLGDTERAAYFTRIFDRARSAGVAGIGFWNLGPELAPTSYEVNPQTALTFAVVQAAGTSSPRGDGATASPLRFQPARGRTDAARMVYRNDFHDPVGTSYPEWRSSPITFASQGRPPGTGALPPAAVTNVESPNHARRFLGEFGGPPLGKPGDPGYNRTRVEQTVSLTLRDLPPHRALRVAFDLYLLKSWDGNSPAYGPDRWSFAVEGGPTLLDTTFSNNPKLMTDGSDQDYPRPGSAPWSGAASTGTLGYGDFFKDSTYRLEFRFPHTARAVRLDFKSSLFEGKGTADESWGLGSVTVETSPGVSSPGG
jgi:cellulase (glycosyl hydrolase family 5)